MVSNIQKSREIICKSVQMCSNDLFGKRFSSPPCELEIKMNEMRMMMMMVVVVVMVVMVVVMQPPFWPDPAPSCVVALNLPDKVAVICLHLAVSIYRHCLAWLCSPCSLTRYHYLSKIKNRKLPQNPYVSLKSLCFPKNPRNVFPLPSFPLYKNIHQW